MTNFWTVVVIAGFVLGGAVQTPATVEVRGVVRDSATGKLLRGVSVQIGRRYSTSDVDGGFVITGVSPGRQLLMASRTDYLLDGIRRPEPGQLPVYHDRGISITVPSTSPVSMDVYMNLTPQASGVVVDAEGHPVEGIEVSAFRLGYDSSGRQILTRTSSPGFSSTTDDRGEFTLNTVPPGDYVFRIDNEFSRRTIVPTYYPSALDLSQAEIVRLRAGDDIGLRPFVLQNSPLPWVTVKVFDEAGDEVNVPVVTVVRTNEPPGLVFSAIGSGLLRLSPGLYEVEALERRTTGSLGETLTAKFARASIEVRDTDATLRMVVKEGTRATIGIFYAHDGVLQPASGIPVRLVPRNFTSRLLQDFNGTSGTDGTVTMAGVPSGTYQLVLPQFSETGERALQDEKPGMPTLQDVCVREIRQGETAITGDEILIGNGPSTMTVILGDSAARVRGSLGVPGGNAIVALVPDDRTQIQRYVATTADADGNFELKCALPGEYRLYAWTDLPGAAYRNEMFMENYKGLGTPLRVTEGGILTVEPILIQP